MPLVDLFFATLWLFLFIIWIWLLIKVLIDVFSSDELGGWAKAGWTVAVLLLPLLGVLVYLIARGEKMRDREFRWTSDGGWSPHSYEHNVRVSSPDTAEEIAKLTALRDKGIITDEELKSEKRKLLA